MFFLAQKRRFLSWIAAAAASLALVIGLPLLTNPTTQTAQAVTTLRVYTEI